MSKFPQWYKAARPLLRKARRLAWELSNQAEALEQLISKFQLRMDAEIKD